MGISSHITDLSNGLSAEVYRRTSADTNFPPGLIVYTEDYRRYDQAWQFFLNDTYGRNMNQNASGTGSSENIHNGGDSVYWTASALSGTWDFASTDQANSGTQSIDGTATINNSQALLSDGTSTVMSNYTSLRGAIYVESWPISGSKQINIVARNSGTNVGNAVNLGSYININNTLSWQNFVIPKNDMGLVSQTIDELLITVVDTGAGDAPSFYLDDLLWAGTGGTVGPFEYIIKGTKGINQYVTKLSFFFVDAVSSSVALAYDKLLAVNSLSNGIGFAQIRNEQAIFTLNIRQLSDIISHAPIYNIQSGGDSTNTWVRIDIPFEPYPIKLFNQDVLRFSVNDDLSGLLEFYVSATIIKEIDVDERI